LRGHQFATLDYLRGVAALAVLAFHFQGALGHKLLPHAYLAVDFFFVLSGFVLAHAYEERLLTGMTPAEFMRVRLVRLYPLYFIGTVIFIVAATISGKLNWTKDTTIAVVSAIAFLPAEDPTQHGKIFFLNVPAWSLLFELIANVAYATIAVRLRTRWLVLLSVVSLLIEAQCFSSLDLGPRWSDFSGGFPRVGSSFLAGVVTYRLWRASEWHPNIRAPLLTLSIPLVLLFVVYKRHPYDPYDFLAVLVFPPIIYLAASAEPLLRLRSSCLWLGAVSYALYITHWPLMRAEQVLIEPSLGSQAPWTGIVLAFVAIFIAAALTRLDPLLRQTLNVLSSDFLHFHHSVVEGRVYASKKAHRSRQRIASRRLEGSRD
jgi:peptidoglycan/LPS O-acetylase OafA/YrhL